MWRVTIGGEGRRSMDRESEVGCVDSAIVSVESDHGATPVH